MKYNKIIFLDIDGVLNSSNYSRKTDISQLNFLFNMEIDPIPLALLKKFISSNPDIKIVISSSWRDTLMLRHFQEIFKPYDSTVIDLISSNYKKSEAIELWLSKNKVQDFIILDDDTLFDLDHTLFKNQIKTTTLYGLTADTIKEIENYFKQK